MSDDPWADYERGSELAPTDPETARLESLLTRQYIERLEALDAETERLLESIAKTEPFDDRTRARARRHLREIRTQIHPLVLALREYADADREPQSDADPQSHGEPRDSHDGPQDSS